MIVLQDANDTLEVVLAANVATAQLPMVTSWRDITASGYTPGRTNLLTNNTTAVTAAGSPAASTWRVIDFYSIRNTDTANATVTVRINDNATTYNLFAVTLGQDEMLSYTEGQGWQVHNSAGAIKTIAVATNNVIQSGTSMTVLAADVTNNNAVANTIADVTALSFPVTAGNKYQFKFFIPYTAAATTTGSRWSINGPASPTFLAYLSRYSLTATTETVNHGMVGYDVPAASNASSAATTGNLAIIEGLIIPSANGTVIARFASEVASSAIVAKAGATVTYQQVA